MLTCSSAFQLLPCSSFNRGPHIQSLEILISHDCRLPELGEIASTSPASEGLARDDPLLTGLSARIFLQKWPQACRLLLFIDSHLEQSSESTHRVAIMMGGRETEQLRCSCCLSKGRTGKTCAASTISPEHFQIKCKRYPCWYAQFECLMRGNAPAILVASLRCSCAHKALVSSRKILLSESVTIKLHIWLAHHHDVHIWCIMHVYNRAMMMVISPCMTSGDAVTSSAEWPHGSNIIGIKEITSEELVPLVDA